MAKCVLMVQGTTSDAGKSVMVAGLCRLLSRKGVNVAPFKPQNMALNSAVTVEGGEIGRAQALQAVAANQPPSIHMNPILIKPESDQRAQIIVHGKQLQSMDAGTFHAYKGRAMDYVLESFERLGQQHEVIIVEGAGSPAEINLREQDIANMGFAEAADCPVLLVADIDRGGVFATVVGTLELLSTSEQQRVLGVVINKFRGDIKLLHSGLRWLEDRINKPVFGVLPYLHNLYLDAEDALAAAQALSPQGATLRIAVVVFPRISNHTDFDALRQHPEVDLQYVTLDQSLPLGDLVILPGTKNVREDLALLQSSDLLKDLLQHLRYGGKLLGICGGLQMLGEEIHDPQGIEAEAGSSKGLGLVSFSTTLEPHKQLLRNSGSLLLNGSDPVSVAGYQIHCGVSHGRAFERPLLQLDDGQTDGFISSDEQIIGTYLHGIFDQPEACAGILEWLGLKDAVGIDASARREQQLERLADTIAEHIDLGQLLPDYFGGNNRIKAWNA